MTPLVTIEVYGAVAFSSPQTDDECRAGVLRGSGPSRCKVLQIRSQNWFRWERGYGLQTLASSAPSARSPRPSPRPPPPPRPSLPPLSISSASSFGCQRYLVLLGKERTPWGAPSWSPDGKTIAYTCSDGDREICTIDARGRGKPFQLTKNDRYDFGPPGRPAAKR
jgi:hypothetical protein